MRRIVALVALSIFLLVPATAQAKGPVANCPSSHSGYFEAGKPLWWENTVEGFYEEDIPVYNDRSEPSDGYTDVFNQFASDAGFGDGAGLYDFVWNTQWDGIDKNGDGVVCMKNRPHTPGNPAFFFNGVDNTAH